MKARRAEFLARNPFPWPLTLGFFYREKMRAIHRIAPDLVCARVLEIGGGQSGLTRLLYPDARVVTLDIEPGYSNAPCNRDRPFVCAGATHLPFGDGVFDAVTMFDILEHVHDDAAAIREALRVLRAAGYLLISSPNERWRFPYHSLMEPLCPSDAEVMREWGHVRRGYAVAQLAQLIGVPCTAQATFINPVTVLSHDLAFSRLPFGLRRGACAVLSPVTWLGYLAHGTRWPGTETASLWRRDGRSTATHESQP